MSKKKIESTKDEEKFVYCGLRKCPHLECLRHYINEPCSVHFVLLM